MADRTISAITCHFTLSWHCRRAVQGLLALVVAVVPFAVTAPAAFAGVGFAAVPTFPNEVTVGQTGLAASVQILNNASPPEDTSNVDITAINLVPACGVSFPGGPNGDCSASDADPGVFQLSPSGVGEVGSACAGTTFSIAVIDPSTGQVSFTPSTPVVLGPENGTGASPTCRIDFTFSVLKAPTKPAGTSAAGTVLTDQLAFAAGTAVSDGVSGSGNGSSQATVALAAPTISTTVSASTSTVGALISDTATLSPDSPPGPAPTGTIQFSLFSNSTCTGTAVFTKAVPVTGTGVYNSSTFAPTAAGTYEWLASYGGDANDLATASACGSEPVSIAVARPSITTTPSGPVTVGSTISDRATLAGGFGPTGTITFDVFGPGHSVCSGSPALPPSVVTVSGNGTYSSSTFTPTAAGTYNYVAAYSGDADNAAEASACASESTVVGLTTPTIATAASGTTQLGGTISDSSVLSGGVAPTGSITFEAFGPGNANCVGTPTFTSNTLVSGNGTYTSATFTTTAATAAGTYQFVASYSGDANNNPVASPCGAVGESVVVEPASPTIATTASPTVPAGGAISDSATLSGGATPTGTITFTLFGPNNATCSGTPTSTSTVNVSGDGVYASATFGSATTPGVYTWVASYSGNGNNNSAVSGCGAANESVTVTPAKPTITTHASATVSVGNPITDTATLGGADAPTGTITFTLFGPNNTTCTGTAVSTSTVSVTGNGSYTSSSFAPTAAGTYNFVAAYSGDTNNKAVASTCGSAGESVAVTTATPTIVTRASASVAVGGQINDNATLSGGSNPTGTITFTIFGPNDATCAEAPVFTSIDSVTAGNGDYSSGPFTTSAAGTYRFVATYGGDANNAAVTTACNSPDESVVVGTANPTLVTTASPSVALGGTVTDTATLSGGFNPTGTIAFDLFGPGNPNCTGVATFTTSVTISGDGNYTSGVFTPTASGTYDFDATYSGDSNNAAVASTPCGTIAETVTVTKNAPAIVTHASASTTTGNSIVDTATLSGASAPSGTIIFNLFGPNDATCSGTPIFTSMVTVAGDGSYTSAPFTTTQSGTYNYVTSYSGDADNNPVTSVCGAANESVSVTPGATSSIVTHASAGVTVGGTIADTATLGNTVGATGTITFNLFGPNDATCSGTPIFTSIVTVAGNGNYTSGSFVVSAAGTYLFTAAYSGDANNSAVTSECGATNESVVVTPAAGGLFTPVTPARDLDTRNGTGGVKGPIAGNTTFALTVTGVNGVPATGVGAVALNVTVTAPTCAAWLTVYPSGQAVPGSSNLNYTAGETIANLVVVGVSAAGQVSFNVPAACAGSVEIVADIAGWYSTQTATVTPGGYTALTPARDLDTRSGTGGVHGPIAGNTTFNLTVTGVNGVPATGVGAVALNVTVTAPTCAAWLTVFPTLQPVPASSNLNYTAGETIANLVVVGVSSGGQVSFNVPAACGGTVQVIADVQGWYAAQSGTASPGSYTALTPGRDLDTRSGTGGVHGPIAGNTTFALTVTGVNGVPATGVGAVALNVTVTNPTCAAWLTVFPTGQAVPGSSNLNYTAGETIANLVIVGVSSAGQISFNVPTACSGSIQIIADIQGWYGPIA